MGENNGTATAARRLSRLPIAVVLVVVGCQSVQQPPEPPFIEGFRQYTSGTRIIEARTSAFPATRIQFTVTPKKPDLKLFIRCDIDKTDREGDRPVDMFAQINGERVAFGACPSSETDVIELEPHVAARHQLDVTVTVQEKRDKGAFAVAVGEVVPHTEYHYPPRPESLTQLGPPVISTNMIVRSATDKATFAWTGQGLLFTRLNTPGVVRVFLNDVNVGECESWDYRREICSLRMSDLEREHATFRPRLGQQVTLTAVADRTTGDWDVAAHL